MPTPRKHDSRAARQRACRTRQTAARRAEREAKGLPRPTPVPTKPGAARWTALREQARALLETLRREMEAYCEERAEQWQESERGETMWETVLRIEEIQAEMENI